jgi:hypothetical protein
VCAVFVAVSVWHVTFSRNGFRAISAPFFMVFGFYFLLRALRRSEENADAASRESAPTPGAASRRRTALPLVDAVLSGLFLGRFHTTSPSPVPVLSGDGLASVARPVMEPLRSRRTRSPEREPRLTVHDPARNAPCSPRLRWLRSSPRSSPLRSRSTLPSGGAVRRAKISSIAARRLAFTVVARRHVP